MATSVFSSHCSSTKLENISNLPGRGLQSSEAVTNTAIPDFIRTDNLPNESKLIQLEAVPKERVSNIITELNTYDCGKKQLEDLKSLCTNNNFQIQFVYFTSKDNGSEYALKVNESITQFGSQSVLHTNIIYICVDEKPPQSVERNVCIYNKTKHTIKKTKKMIIKHNPKKTDAYKVGHELSHATVFIKFLSDIKKCFKDYVELTGTKKENIYNVSVKDKYHQDTTLNEYQKNFLNAVATNCTIQSFNSLNQCFIKNVNAISKEWQETHHENLLNELTNNLNENAKNALKSLFHNGEEARNLLGLNESMDFNSSNKTIGEFHYINKIYQESHGNKYNIIRMPYNSKANWNEITDCDEIIKRIFQKKFNLKDDEI